MPRLEEAERWLWRDGYYGN